MPWRVALSAKRVASRLSTGVAMLLKTPLRDEMVTGTVTFVQKRDAIAVTVLVSSTMVTKNRVDMLVVHKAHARK